MGLRGFRDEAEVEWAFAVSRIDYQRRESPFATPAMDDRRRRRRARARRPIAGFVWDV
jgi:hypothetical protein